MSLPLSDLPTVIDRMREVRPQVSEAELRSAEWKEVVCEHLKASRLPPRFWYEVKKWNPSQKRVFNECCGLLQGVGAIVALVGERGLGKTTMAAQIIIGRAWNENAPPWHRRPPYRKLTDIIATFKPLYADFGSIDLEALRERRNNFCADHPLIVVDELHECDEQKLKDRILTDILDRRYANRVDTLLISNQTPDEFRQTTNDSVLSRLSEHGQIIHCKWKSFRSNP